MCNKYSKHIGRSVKELISSYFLAPWIYLFSSLIIHKVKIAIPNHAYMLAIDVTCECSLTLSDSSNDEPWRR